MGWEHAGWERQAFYPSFSFRLFTGRSHRAGPVVDVKRFETVVRLYRVYVVENVRGSRSKLGTELGDLRDVGRRRRRLEGRLEQLAIGKDARQRGISENWGPATILTIVHNDVSSRARPAVTRGWQCFLLGG